MCVHTCIFSRGIDTCFFLLLFHSVISFLRSKSCFGSAETSFPVFSELQPLLLQLKFKLENPYSWVPVLTLQAHPAAQCVAAQPVFILSRSSFFLPFPHAQISNTGLPAYRSTLLKGQNGLDYRVSRTVPHSLWTSSSTIAWVFLNWAEQNCRK